MSKFDKKLVESKQTYLHIKPQPEPEEPKLQIEDVQTFTGACDYFEEAWSDFKLGGMQAPTLSGVTQAAKTVGNTLTAPKRGLGHLARGANDMYQKFTKGAAEFAGAAKEGGAIGLAGHLAGSVTGKKEDGEESPGPGGGSSLGADGSGLRTQVVAAVNGQPINTANIGSIQVKLDPPTFVGHILQWKTNP